MRIVARQEQIRQLVQALSSQRPELVAVWGRRRVGKTYLLHHCITQHRSPSDLYIHLTGGRAKDGSAQDVNTLITNFRVSLVSSIGADPEIHTPEDIFVYLAKLSRDTQQQGRRLILFLDEFPWLCEIRGKRFDFYQSFEHLWNEVLSKSNAKVFICGSAASWMLKHIVYPKDGLAKRITKKIRLSSFDLRATKQFLQHKGFELSAFSIIELHMTIGGIPFYLDKLDAKKSIRQNLYDLMVHHDGLLSGSVEYDHLFNYLFSDPSYYKKIVAALVDKRAGKTVAQIAHLIGEGDPEKASGKLNETLSVLSESEIFSRRVQFYNKRRGSHYFLVDEYIRFYTQWFKEQPEGGIDYAGFCRILDSQAYRIWRGFNFENLCYRHYPSITKALGIAGLTVSPHVFYHYDKKTKKINCQIDLLLDRSDNMITICEAKFYEDEYAITEGEYKKLLRRREALKEYLRSKRTREKDFNFCILHSNGIAKNKYYELLNPATVSAQCFLD